MPWGYAVASCNRFSMITGVRRTDMKIDAKRLKSLRQTQAWTQEDLAERLTSTLGQFSEPKPAVLPQDVQ